jgi:signal transduction histidine kinase
MATLEIVVISTGIFAFLLTLVLAALRLRQPRELTVHTRRTLVFLLVYSGFGLAATFSILAGSLNVQPLWGGFLPYPLISQAGLLGMIATFGAGTLIFLNREPRLVTGYLIAAALLFLLWLLPVTGVITTVEPKILSQVGWLGALGTVYVALLRALRNQHSSKHVNRLRYLLVAATLHAAAGLIFFFSPVSFLWAGMILLLVGVGLYGYTVMSYHTPDLNRLIGHTIRYFAVTALIAALFYLGLAATIILSRTAEQPVTVLLWSVVASLLLAMVTPPLWRLLDRLVQRLVFGAKQRSETEIVRHYSRRISSSLDMQRLADILLELMTDTLQVEEGAVFINERSGGSIISLKPLASAGFSNLTPFQFEPDSLFINYFRQGHKYLHQYDIDVLPQFANLGSGERAWLRRFKAEVFVPISRMGNMMGLLAFGKRHKEAAYHQEELDLMVSLADQAVLAMDSARLFQQLATINQEVDTLSNQLAGMDQNKTDFLSIASHELRTPLTHMHGYSRMLLDLTEEETRDVAYVRTIVSGIVKGTERMKNVMDMMFDVTEANIGEMALFLGPVDLDELLGQVTGPFLTVLDERRIAFDKQGLAELPTLEADGNRLMQALENLLSNAIKYTPDGGMVTVSGTAVLLDSIGSAVEIVVADTGIGIDPEYHDRIFEKFFRVDDADHHSTGRTKFKGAGPGLGLTLVKAIAETHGGSVRVESEGHDEETLPGSKFIMTIPLHPVITEKKSGQKQSQIETIQWRRKDMTKPKGFGKK